MTDFLKNFKKHSYDWILESMHFIYMHKFCISWCCMKNYLILIKVKAFLRLGVTISNNLGLVSNVHFLEIKWGINLVQNWWHWSHFLSWLKNFSFRDWKWLELFSLRRFPLSQLSQSEYKISVPQIWSKILFRFSQLEVAWMFIILIYVTFLGITALWSNILLLMFYRTRTKVRNLTP